MRDDLSPFDAMHVDVDAWLNGTASMVGATGPTSYTVEPGSISSNPLLAGFVNKYRGRIRYVDVWGKYLFWNGSKWEIETTRQAFDLCRKYVEDNPDEGQAKPGNVHGFVRIARALETAAKATRAIGVKEDIWDRDTWLLNTPGGAVDLRSGDIKEADPRDYCTRVTAVAPENRPCPMWHAFLDKVTGGDRELVAYLRRVFGYALTGETIEHSLFFAYGTGANGKSVLLSTIAGIMGDYHKTAPIETFCATNGDRHPTDLAGLRGARLVTAVETEEGRRWAESRIKTLTGGDPVSARFMRQDFFEFIPQFKLFIAGNHKPGLRSVDEAIRRRFHLVPFAVTVPPAERDPDLTEKLKAEWPAILQWAIEGCLDWQGTGGLPKPAAVAEATAKYLEDEDALAAWLDEKCETDKRAWEQSSTLFASWSAWADAAGENAGNMRRFSQALESHGLFPQRRMNGRGFNGLRLKTSNSWDEA
jgi:putative DNA primase/helicase